MRGPVVRGKGATDTCPSWCVAPHGVQGGEENWVHTGKPVPVADGLLARLCMSVHPETGVRDGPYVVIGSSELTLAETGALGASLLALAGAVPTVATDP